MVKHISEKGGKEKRDIMQQLSKLPKKIHNSLKQLIKSKSILIFLCVCTHNLHLRNYINMKGQSCVDYFYKKQLHQSS